MLLLFSYSGYSNVPPISYHFSDINIGLGGPNLIDSVTILTSWVFSNSVAWAANADILAFFQTPTRGRQLPISWFVSNSAPISFPTQLSPTTSRLAHTGFFI